MSPFGPLGSSGPIYGNTIPRVVSKEMLDRVKSSFYTSNRDREINLKSTLRI